MGGRDTLQQGCKVQCESRDEEGQRGGDMGTLPEATHQWQIDAYSDLF